MKRLFTWYDGAMVGTFTLDSAGDVGFSYSEAAPFPVSLSMPIDGGWKAEAPYRFLDGLLPDDNNERWRMKDALGAASIHPFDLLDNIDTAGGLTFTSKDHEPSFTEAPLVPFTTEDIEAEMRRISTSAANPWDVELKGRYSLAGTQGKFTMTKFGDMWFKPSGAIPSTHIVKPDIKGLPGSALVENATMDLVDASGIPVPHHGMLTAGSTSAFLIERFDRLIQANGLAKRLHIEDMTQSLGVSRDEKYDVEAVDICRALTAVNPTGEMAYSWFEQFALNCCVGNCDAHAKNYSVIIGPERVVLSPMYDVVSTMTWDQFDKALAMTVNGKWYPWEITPLDWKAEAERAGLDGWRVADRAMEISMLVREAARDALEQLPLQLRDRAIQSIGRSNEAMDPIRDMDRLEASFSDMCATERVSETPQLGHGAGSSVATQHEDEAR